MYFDIFIRELVAYVVSVNQSLQTVEFVAKTAPQYYTNLILNHSNIIYNHLI